MLINYQTEKLVLNLHDWIPKTIDDIIRVNKDKLKLEYVQFGDLLHLNKPLPMTSFKGAMEDAFLYKRIIRDHPIEHVFLVGYLKNGNSKIVYHTSPVTHIDLEANTILTHSGSHYSIENFCMGEPQLNLLLHICAVAHHDGWGAFFEVPEVFY